MGSSQAYYYAYRVTCNMYVLDERLSFVAMYCYIMIMIYERVFAVWNLNLSILFFVIKHLMLIQ